MTPALGCGLLQAIQYESTVDWSVNADLRTGALGSALLRVPVMSDAPTSQLSPCCLQGGRMCRRSSGWCSRPPASHQTPASTLSCAWPWAPAFRWRLDCPCSTVHLLLQQYHTHRAPCRCRASPPQQLSMCGASCEQLHACQCRQESWRACLRVRWRSWTARTCRTCMDEPLALLALMLFECSRDV